MKKTSHTKDKVEYEQIIQTDPFVPRVQGSSIWDFLVGERFDIIWIFGWLYLLQCGKLISGALDDKKLFKKLFQWFRGEIMVTGGGVLKKTHEYERSLRDRLGVVD